MYHVVSVIKTIVLPYLLVFLLIYLGPVQVGPTSFSQVWKIPLLLFLIWEIVVIRSRKKHGFIQWSYARAIKNLIAGGFSVSYVAAVVDFLRYLMFPLLFEYISLKVKDLRRLDSLLLGFAQFIIVSGLPFVLGILESKAVDVITYKGFDSYAGMFQNTHGTAIATTTAVLVLIFFIKQKSTLIRYKALNYAILAFGIYLIYATFIRTGYVMFFVGLLVIYTPKKLNVKQLLSAGLALSVLVVAFLYLLETNEVFYNRIFDIRNGKQTAAGSGRLLFWEASVDLWLNGSVFELFFGSGYEALLDKIGEVTGIRVYAHNEIFTQLGQNGLLGVVFFIGFLISLFKFIWNRRRMPSYRMALAVYFLYTSLMLTQGGMWFELDVFMVLVFVKLELEGMMYTKAKQHHAGQTETLKNI